MRIVYIFFFLTVIGLNNSLFGQETLPIYTDYLTDNMYLIHPAGAGISDYGKIRVTGRKQWLDYSNAPELQTLSFHMPLGSKSAIGAVGFNDKIGHFSKAGGQLSYAHHINFEETSVNQLSFGISFVFLQNTLDGRDYILQDSDVTNTIISKSYFNADVGMAYRNKGFYSFYTIKNLLLAKRDLFDNSTESNNLRKHLISLGYFFNEGVRVKLQPSIMGQYIEQTKEFILDTNLKAFVPIKKGEFWGGLSYRRSFDSNTLENTNHIASFLGIKLKQFIVSYAYTKQVNNVVFDSGNFHQITLGYNFKIQKYRTATWDL